MPPFSLSVGPTALLLNRSPLPTYANIIDVLSECVNFEDLFGVDGRYNAIYLY